MRAVDVIVVGAGPVGVLSALGLARAGHSVLVLERGHDVVESPRAMVYHWAVLDGLDELGVLDDALAAGFTKQDYNYRVFATGENISWSMAPLSAVTSHPFNLHLGQNVLANIALDHLSRHANATVRFDATVATVQQDDEGVTVALDDGESVRGGWLVAADGAASVVRRELGVEFAGMTWPERFVATNIRYPFQNLGYGHANMVVDPLYGAVVAKIDASGLWRVTYMEDAALPEENVRARLPDYFDVLLHGDRRYELDDFSPYRMHQRSASTYRVGRVLLAGDAAHATNPTGGLGLTSGLLDLYALIPALAAVMRRTSPASVLDRYADERRRVFLEIASPAATENKRFVYGSDDPERLNQDVAQMRAMVADPDLLWKRLTFPFTLRTEPLVDADGRVRT